MYRFNAAFRILRYYGWLILLGATGSGPVNAAHPIARAARLGCLRVQRTTLPKRTLALIKPDATACGFTLDILARTQEDGFTVVACKEHHLTKAQAEEFYKVHAGKPFYEELTEFMSSGPLTAMVLEREDTEDAIHSWRRLIGAANPAHAGLFTLRKLYAQSTTKNALHGSDSEATAAQEIAFFFPHL